MLQIDDRKWKHIHIVSHKVKAARTPILAAILSLFILSGCVHHPPLLNQVRLPSIDRFESFQNAGCTFDDVQKAIAEKGLRIRSMKRAKKIEAVWQTGVNLTFYFEHNSLEEVDIAVSRDVLDSTQKNGLVWKDENSGLPCCMSMTLLESIVDWLNTVKPTGKIMGHSDFNIVGPSGYIRRGVFATRASFSIRQQTNIEGGRLGITSFSVSYILPLEGTVKKKWIDPLDSLPQSAGLPSLYWIRISDENLEITREMFGRINVGDSVRLLYENDTAIWIEPIRNSEGSVPD